MAVVAMKKLTIVGMSDERTKLVRALSRTGCVHISSNYEFDKVKKLQNPSTKAELVSKMAEVEAAMQFVKGCLSIKQRQLIKQGDKKTNLSTSVSKKVSIDYESFAQASENELHLFSRVIDKTKEINARFKAIEVERTSARSTIESLEPYLSFSMSFSNVKNTTSTVMMLGMAILPSQAKWEEFLKSFELAEVVVVNKFNGQSVLFAICHNSIKDTFSAALAEFGFSKCGFNYDLDALRMSNGLKDKLEQLTVEYELLLEKACSLKEYFDDLKVLYDYYSISLQLTSADEEVLRTESTFILQAWLPKEKQDAVSEMIYQNTSAVYTQFEEPGEEDRPPTAYKNSKLVAPFESVVDMYGRPNYREIDPSPFVAIFYWIFFGVILGDLGYGVILALGGFLALKYLKPQGGMKKLLGMFALGGLSAVIWGVVFGGWLGLSGSFIPKPLFVNPQESPMETMGLCVALGIIQVITGVAIKAAAAIREGKIWDAIFDSFTWIGFLVGLSIYVVGMLLAIPLLNTIGMYTAIVSIVIIALTAGRAKKSIVGKLMSGLGGVYGFMNYLNDILSYLRLFGLLLAGGVVGMVFNQIAGMLMGSWFMIPFGIAVAVVGHTLNIALGLLSVYVHNGRLQQIEFFSKFYTGDGYAFKPFGNETKYTTINS